MKEKIVSRTKVLLNNILLSSILKGIGLLTSFLVVPITLNYLDKEQYGIWMTLSSILFWFSFFDVGLGNGLRNYLTHAIAKGDFGRGRAYVTTTFVMLTIIALLLALIFVTFSSFADVSKIFNTKTFNSRQLYIPVLLAIIMTLIAFIVKNVGIIYIALQRYAINDFIIVSSNVVALLLTYLCVHFAPYGNLTIIVLIFTTSPVIAFLIAAISVFRHNPLLRPNLKSFNWKYGKRILSKSIGFFLIQITSCLVIFGSSNLFIIQFDGPEAVTTYNICYKYFNVLAIAYTIVVSPMWNAFTEAYANGDYCWIRLTFLRALKIWGISVIGGIFMVFLSKHFYQIWIGDSVEIPFSLSLCVLFYIAFFNLNNCATMLINGLNKIRMQIITSIVVTSMFLIVVTNFGFKLGVEGIIICMAASYAIMAVIHLYQCYLILNQNATGVWNK